MKKKIMMAVTTALLTCAVLSGCAKKEVKKDAEMTGSTGGKVASAMDKKFQVVTTIFPEYDWVKEVVGERAENFDITYLMEKGVDLHSYQPSAEDISKISGADLFVHVGGGSGKWAEDAIEERTNPNMQVVNLMASLGSSVKSEEMVEGMQEHDHDHAHEHGDHDHAHEDKDHDHEHEDKEHDHAHEHEDKEHDHAHEHEDKEHDHAHEHGDHDHEHEDKDHDHAHEHEDKDHDHAHEHEDKDHNHDHDHHHEHEYDEHVWLSLKNAVSFVNEISNKLQVIDPEYKDVYKKNAEAYVAKLMELDHKFEETVKNAPKKTLLFGDRFPFRYLVDDYGLKYYAAFAGCSAETEASFETVAFLAKKTDELGLGKVCVIENSNEKIAKTIIENTKDKNHEIVVLNSMQSITGEDIKAGKTYYSIMEENLKALESAIQ